MKSVLSAIVGMIAVSGAFAQTPPPKMPTPPMPTPEYLRAVELVKQLGSARYKEREKAAAELVKMGRTARQALEEGKRDKDPEIYVRCEQLLPQALMLDLQHRIDAYLKDTEGKQEHDLPLLKTFQQKIGKGELERKLFADMLKTNGLLFDSVKENPEGLTQKVATRTQEMYQEIYGNQQFGGRYKPNAVSPSDIAAVMFVSSMAEYKPAQPDYLFQSVYSQANFQTSTKDATNGGPYRKVMINFFESRLDDNMANQMAYMFCQWNLKEAAPIMLKGVKENKIRQPYSRAIALGCVGTLGGKECLPMLKELFNDETLVNQFNAPGQAGQGKVNVQDIALAASIHIAGKNPKDYGFRMWQFYAQQPLQYHQLGFVTNEERKAAFKKWDEDSKKLDDKKEDPKKDPPKKDPPKVDPPKVDPPKKDPPKELPKK